VLDSLFISVGEVIRINKRPRLRPAIYLDNLLLLFASHVVKEDKGDDVYTYGRSTTPGWGMGWRFTDSNPNGANVNGEISPKPTKPRSLLTPGGQFFEKSKPLYRDLLPTDVINVLQFNVQNDGTNAAGNTAGINTALQSAAQSKKILVFPAGVYAVDNTLNIPPGSRIVGVLWSQIVATGAAFSDPLNPIVLAK
jgi:glucan 1,3-beta-glucosidase